MAQAGSFGDPGVEIRAITPSNDTDLTGCRGVFTTDAGSLAVRTIYGASSSSAVTIADMPIGMVLPLRVTRVMATGTTATQIYGLF
jgi:hypothetical protein